MTEEKAANDNYITIFTTPEIDEEVIISQETDSGVPGAETIKHAGIPFVSKKLLKIEKKVDFRIVKKSWEKSAAQIKELLQSSTDATAPGFKLEEISFSLTISGKGTVGIAELGGNASITIKFKRSSS